MKKENRKMAMERRAKERARMNRQKKLRKFAGWAVPILLVLVVAGPIAVSVLDAKSSSDSGSVSGSTQDKSASSSSENGYSTDTALTVADGSTVNIDYVGTIDGVEFSGGNTNGHGTDLTIGSHSYIDDFEEQLIGHHPGDQVDVTVTFPEDYGKESLNGREALFQVTINGIYQ